MARFDTDYPDDPHEECREQIEIMQERLDEITSEVVAVLMLMDDIAAICGDEEVYRVCRERLRVFVPKFSEGDTKCRDAQ